MRDEHEHTECMFTSNFCHVQLLGPNQAVSTNLSIDDFSIRIELCVLPGCGLARSQGNGGGGLRARGQREDAVGLKL